MTTKQKEQIENWAQAYAHAHGLGWIRSVEIGRREIRFQTDKAGFAFHGFGNFLKKCKTEFKLPLGARVRERFCDATWGTWRGIPAFGSSAAEALKTAKQASHCGYVGDIRLCLGRGEYVVAGGEVHRLGRGGCCAN